jgi:outer membrane receptor protein involved in Fe transport
MFDARIDKDFKFGDDSGVTLSIDGFNLLNEDYVLQRFRNVDGGDANQVKEVLSPRVFRLGVKLHFR